ncbi:MAG: hypothetical protein R3266_07470, partial [Gemmatimonadota bacterium]|nr:hypothetical protein [Gemmatimonadota bacterium]
MNDDPGARHRQEMSASDTPTEPRPEQEPASPNPFALLEGGGGSVPAKDVLARLSRILGAARSEATLEGPVRTVTAAWLDADAWQVGLGLDRIADGGATVSALAVSDRAGVEPWREAVAGTEAGDFSTLMDEEESSVPADRLPGALAALAKERGLDRVDLFPIGADGRTAGLIAMLRNETSAPAPQVRRAMELSRDILSQIAARVRAREAVAGAARHIRSLTTDGAERSGASDRKETDRSGSSWRARYELLHRGAEAGLWDWDLERDAFRVSPRWRKLLGYEGEDATDEPSAWFDRIHP